MKTAKVLTKYRKLKKAKSSSDEAERIAHVIKRGMAKKFWADIEKLRKERSKLR